MPSLNIPAKQIKGLLPAIDRRTVSQPFVMEGRNFLVDLKGPYAAFTNRIFTRNTFENPQLVQSFRTDDGDTIYATQGAMFKIDTVSQRFVLLFTFDDPGFIARWWGAVVNGIYFFARKGINGVIMYDPTDQSFTLLSGANIPDQPISVCTGAGRLVVMSEKFIAWSALGDGTNMAPDLTTGAGFQALALMGGKGICVTEVADGVITYTTKGAMKSEFSYQLNTFRHYPLDRSFTPINSFCVEPLNAGRQWVLLDRKGFYVTSGQGFEEFEPMMSEYFSKTLLPTLDISNPQMIRLEYSENLKLLFVSILSANLNGIYDFAYVLYRPTDEWGIFNYKHYGMIEMAATSGPLKGYQMGFISEDGDVHYFTLDTFVEADISDPLAYFFRTDFDTPIRVVNGTLIATADLHIHQEDEAQLVTSGLYTYDTNGNFTVYNPVDAGVNSYIKIGLFRYTEQKYDDELGTVTNIKLSVDNFPGTQDFIDYNNVATATSIDYNNVPTDVTEDWGSGILSSSIFTANITGTNDGETVFAGNQENLTLSIDAGDDKYYVCFNTGVFHIVELQALVPNKTFHLRLMELSGSLAGRI